jgi:hypothetical protein
VGPSRSSFDWAVSWKETKPLPPRGAAGPVRVQPAGRVVEGGHRIEHGCADGRREIRLAHENVSTDVGKAKSSYTDLLGWETEAWKMGEMEYPIIKA